MQTQKPVPMAQPYPGAASQPIEILQKTPSHLEVFLAAAKALPDVPRQMFDALYRQGRPAHDVARALGLTGEQFEATHSAMLRSLKARAATT